MSCKVDQSDNRNNGLMTKIWGGPTWTANHAIAFGYPIEPTDEQKKEYREYFISLGNVLPCRFCRDSYKKIINTDETKITDEIFTNRNTLTKWFYDVHEAVNNKLGVDYGVTYPDVVNRFESFRAQCGKPNPLSNISGCIAPLDYKAFSYQKLNQTDCPIIQWEMVEPFVRLARIRGLSTEWFSFIQFAEEFNGKICRLKKQPVWSVRNKFCKKQIDKMREAGIPSIETEGIWKNTPTIEELQLMMFLCTNLGHSEIRDSIRALMTNQIYLSQMY